MGAGEKKKNQWPWKRFTAENIKKTTNTPGIDQSLLWVCSSGDFCCWKKQVWLPNLQFLAGWYPSDSQNPHWAACSTSRHWWGEGNEGKLLSPLGSPGAELCQSQWQQSASKGQEKSHKFPAVSPESWRQKKREFLAHTQTWGAPWAHLAARVLCWAWQKSALTLRIAINVPSILQQNTWRGGKTEGKGLVGWVPVIEAHGEIQN